METAMTPAISSVNNADRENRGRKCGSEALPPEALPTAARRLRSSGLKSPKTARAKSTTTSGRVIQAHSYRPDGDEQVPLDNVAEDHAEYERRAGPALPFHDPPECPEPEQHVEISPLPGSLKRPQKDEWPGPPVTGVPSESWRPGPIGC